MRRQRRAAAAVAVAVALVLAWSGAGSANPESAVANAVAKEEQYTTAKAKSLAATYRARLLQFAEQIYHCMPWVSLEVNGNGVGFTRPKGAQADDRYLSVWIAVDQQEDGAFAALPQERRVSAMFSRYGVDMLRRMTALGDVVADANVHGLSVILSWLKPGTRRPGAQPVTETLALFIDKATAQKFLARQLPAEEFTNRARFTVFDGQNVIGRLPLEIWEDTFNASFMLKGLEPPKSQKCSSL